MVTTTRRISGTKRSHAPPGVLVTRCLTTLAMMRKLRQQADKVVVYQLRWVTCLMMKISLGIGSVGGSTSPLIMCERPSSGMLCSMEMIWCQLEARHAAHDADGGYEAAEESA